MIRNIKNYKTIVFDCDGVILNSNNVKTLAFYNAALPYGENAAKSLVDYHISIGGVSRYKKFAWFFENVVCGKEGPGIDELLKAFAHEVTCGLENCEIDSGLHELRERTSKAKWLIISGGDQFELRDVFNNLGMIDLFNGGIFGSPETKEMILTRELTNDSIQLPALYIGDSKYDYQAATSVGLDFIFISQWTEVNEWQNWTNENQITALHSLKEMVSC